jgi:hypothetical protein
MATLIFNLAVLIVLPYACRDDASKLSNQGQDALFLTSGVSVLSYQIKDTFVSP